MDEATDEAVKLIAQNGEAICSARTLAQLRTQFGVPAGSEFSNVPRLYGAVMITVHPYVPDGIILPGDGKGNVVGIRAESLALGYSEPELGSSYPPLGRW